MTKEQNQKKRYKTSEGKKWIEVRVKSSQQLFDVRDPAPFRERDLDDDFTEYIFASAREFSLSTPLKIIIYVEEAETQNLSKEAIKEAFHSYLVYQIDLKHWDLKSFIKRAQLFLLIGVSMLIFCLSVAQNLTIPSTPGAMGILREGLVIFGWVSVWKPIELILFDWYPLYEKLRFYRKLLTTEIDIRFGVK